MRNLKKIVFILVMSMIFTISSYAQEAKTNTYVIEFLDKGTNISKALNPLNYLSEKAVNRRLKYNIPFSFDDLPLNEDYCKQLLSAEVKIVARSRWFNLVVIEVNSEKIAAIKNLPFVKKVKLLDLDTQSSRIRSSEETKFQNPTPWVFKAKNKSTTSDIYDYGASYTQIHQLNGEYLHNNGFSGQGMTIAVLDAGFNSVDVMTCFDSLKVNNQIKGTRDFVQPGNNVFNTTIHTHGTSVLSCMAAYVNGVMVGTAPKADYYLIRTEDGTSEYIMEEYFWVMGAEYADSLGVDLINSSLGYTTFFNTATNHTYEDMDGNSTMVTRGADKAAEKGILVVNSAGNEGGSLWKYIGAPADGDSVFSIGAVDGLGARAGFSSVGPTYDRRIKPTVAAMGSGTAVFSPSGLGYGSGTSFSSPITCGMTACLWQAIPAYNNMQIIETIKLTSSQASQTDSLLGWGIPDFAKALTTNSIAEKNAVKEISCFPNPFLDNITISFAEKLPEGQIIIEIFDLNSRLIESSTLSGFGTSTISINNLAQLKAGIYLLKVSIGRNVYFTRIVKM